MTGEPRRPSRLDPGRLRVPEWLVGAAGLMLLVDLLAVPWYGVDGVSASGWSALSVLRWLVLLTSLTGVGVALAQAWCRAPAVPVTGTVLCAVLSLIALIALIVRTLDPPGSLDLRAGAWIGLLAGAALFAGAVASLRKEGILERDGPRDIPTLSI